MHFKLYEKVIGMGKIILLEATSIPINYTIQKDAREIW